MADLIPFHFGNHEVRVHVDEHNHPWWVAKDVCEVLALRNVSNAVGRLKTGEKAVRQADNLLIINESGLYRLIFRSDKEEAQVFQTWVFHDVLPQIRKTGKFEIAPALDRFPELRAIVELAQSTAEARILAEEAKADAALAQAEAARATANTHRLLETQLFFTIAEYVYINGLQAQLPESAYKACSDHLRIYCLDYAIPFRRTPVGGKRWDDEYSYHMNVYTEALPGWLKRRFSQASLHVIHTS